MADFPLAIHSFASVTNDEDVIDASHMNSAHAELTAIEQLLCTMQNILEGWKYDRDYREGLDLRYVDGTEGEFQPGSVCISGSVVHVSGALTVGLADVLRSGDSLSNNTLYHNYGYISGTNLGIELSTSGPDNSLYHPDDTSRRWLSSVRRGVGTFQRFDQYRETTFITATAILGYGGTFAYSAVDLTGYLPPNTYEILLMVYATGDASARVSFECTFDDTNFPGLAKHENTNIASGKLFTTTFWLPYINETFKVKATYCAYIGAYLLGFRAHSRRY